LFTSASHHLHHSHAPSAFLEDSLAGEQNLNYKWLIELRQKLKQIFNGEEVSFSDPPPNKVREEDKPLPCKKGIIALRD